MRPCRAEAHGCTHAGPHRSAGDVVVGAAGASGNTGRAYVYFGSASGIARTAGATLIGPDGVNGRFGFSVASAGDVNGDGYAEVVIGAPTASSVTGRAYVYLGGATGLGTMSETSLTGPDGVNGNFGVSVASAGDVNGDGYAEVVVGAVGVSSSTGRAYLHLGSASGLGVTAGATLTGPDGANGYFGVSVF